MDAEAPAAALAEPAPAKRPSRALAALALLLALAAAAAAGYALWRVEFANPSAARLTREAARLEGAIDAAKAAARAALDERAAALGRRLAAQQDALDALAGEVAGALTARHRDGPPDTRDWQLAEAEYLLRIANGRLVMERDVAAARRLLDAADALLEELDDFALHRVRAALAAERLALAQTPATGAQTLFLRLEAVKDSLAGLPTKRPAAFTATAPPPAAGAGGELTTPPTIWRQLLRRFAGAFDYRTRSSVAPRPLLRPDEALYLELNLRLALERAQLGALRGDATLYAKSLASATRWLTEYVDLEDPRSQGVAQALDDAARLKVDAPLPDISRSLALLRRASRAPALETLGGEPGPAPPAASSKPTQ